jgi:hypothetical protein
MRAERDILRPDKAAPACLGIHTREHCGSLRKKRHGRTCPFLHIAMGSAIELEHHLLLARDLQLLAKAGNERLAGDVTGIKRMPTALIQKLTVHTVRCAGQAKATPYRRGRLPRSDRQPRSEWPDSLNLSHHLDFAERAGLSCAWCFENSTLLRDR